VTVEMPTHNYYYNIQTGIEGSKFGEILERIISEFLSIIGSSIISFVRILML